MNKRYIPALLVVALGGLLLLPLLGTSGLWDPSEIRLADLARDLVSHGRWMDLTLQTRLHAPSFLNIWLIALSLKMFGLSEWAARLPFALCGLLGALAAYRVGSRLLGRDVGMLSAFVLLTTPLYLFQSRQLVSLVPFYAALLAGVGGLTAYIWPRDGRRCAADLLMAGVGLVGGSLARGIASGAVIPLACLATALAVSHRVVHREAVKSPWAAQGGEHVPLDQPLLAALRSAAWPVGLTLLVCAAVLGGLVWVVAPRALLVAGGHLHHPTFSSFDDVIKDFGFGSFPWFAVVPLALGSFILRRKAAAAHADENSPSPYSREYFIYLLVFMLVVLGYAGNVFFADLVGPLDVMILPWALWGAGFWIVDVWRRRDARPAWGIVAVAIIWAIQQDYGIDPQALAFTHLSTKPTFAAGTQFSGTLRLFGILFVLPFYLALSGSPIPESFGPRILRRIASWLNQPRLYWSVVATVALCFAAWCAFVLTPSVSYHMSSKALFATYQKCKRPNEALAQYHVTDQSAAYYSGGKVRTVGSQEELFSLLRQPERVFVVLSSSGLAPLDQAARREKVPYYVVDARNSKLFLITNRLEFPCAEDENPVRKWVHNRRPTPKHVVVANFDNQLKLIGYDASNSVTRGGSWPITLYFEVLGQLPPDRKIFIHVDKPASRIQGDHDPLDGKYPTQYWLPGTYIADTYNVDLPILTTAGGLYTIYMGFWRGDDRIKVVSGPNDGANRVKLGTVYVR